MAVCPLAARAMNNGWFGSEAVAAFSALPPMTSANAEAAATRAFLFIVGLSTHPVLGEVRRKSNGRQGQTGRMEQRTVKNRPTRASWPRGAT